MCVTKIFLIEDYLSKGFPDTNNESSSEEKKHYLEECGFNKNLNGKYQFSHNQFSRFFCKYVKVVLLNNNQDLAVYNSKKGVFEQDCYETICKIIKYIMNKIYDLWNPSYEATALKTIKHDTFEMVQQFNEGEYINLIDGVLDLYDYKLRPHSPDYLSTVQLPFCFNSNKETPIFTKYLNDITCCDIELQSVLQELSGYCLSSCTKAEKAFFLVGKGSNGKSVYAKLLQKLIGDNYSTTSLSDLNGNFGLAQLINSNVNIAAENDNGKINSEIFKAIVSGDTVEVNRKYKDALSVALHTKLVLLFNELPESNDLSYGFFRKIIIIPFNRTFIGDEIDVNLLDKLNDELSGIFHWAIKGLQRLRHNNYVFTDCKVCNKALENYKKSLNPVAVFFEECFIIDSTAQIKKSDIYHMYINYCNANSYEILQCQKFWRLLKFYFAEKQYQFRIKKIKGYEYIEGISYKELN